MKLSKNISKAVDNILKDTSDKPKRKTEMESGTPVNVRRDNGEIVKTVTESKPWLLGGHTWVVLVKGISGCYALSRVTPIK